jgi:hypothetical protein
LQRCPEVVITEIHDIVTGGNVKKEALLQFFLAPLLTESKEEAVAYLRKEGIDIEESKKQFRELMEKHTNGRIVKRYGHVNEN